jgi:O-antigen ligase
VGVLTPVLAINAFVRFKFPRLGKVDKAFLYWSVVVLLSCLLLLFYDPLSLLSIEFVLKLSLPVYLYFFLRLLIRDLRDLHGVLTAFLYGGIFVALLLIYETVVNPIAIEQSRGLERIQASFGDVVSYGMYIIFALAIATYFYFSRQHVVSSTKRWTLVGVVAGLGVLGLINIYHTATYTIFFLIIALFVAFNLRSKNSTAALGLIVIMGLGLSFWGSEVIEERITPLVETDLQVYSGAQDTDKLLHGRVGRWRKMLQQFSSEAVPVQFFGYSLKFEYVFQYIGIGSHNDFIRMLFATGIIGLIFYLRLLWRIWSRRKDLGLAQQYLLYAVLLALVFYSISVTPTFYAPFMYFALTVFAFVALPVSERKF